MVIAHILMFGISLYDPQKPKNKNPIRQSRGDCVRGPLGSAVKNQKFDHMNLDLDQDGTSNNSKWSEIGNFWLVYNPPILIRT